MFKYNKKNLNKTKSLENSIKKLRCTLFICNKNKILLLKIIQNIRKNILKKRFKIILYVYILKK